MNLLVVIPALNEERSIGKVIDQVRESLPFASALVVDDGSSDSTAKVAKEHGAIVVSLPFNVGVGGAVRVAFKFALQNGFSTVLQIDADGQHLPSEALALIDQVEKDSIVVGSRFSDNIFNYKINGARRFAMRVLAQITSAICETKLTDVTSGFRIATGKSIHLFARDYPREYLGDTVESLIIAHKSGIKIKEVPVRMNPREFGEPSQNFLKSFWYLIRVLLVVTLSIYKKPS